jgi:hypothetical protein
MNFLFPNVQGDYINCNFQGATKYFGNSHLGFMLVYLLGFDWKIPSWIQNLLF